MLKQITVKGSWLKACGKGDTDQTFDVIETMPTMAANGSGFEVMYKIQCEGRDWTVARCRTIDG